MRGRRLGRMKMRPAHESLLRRLLATTFRKMPGSRRGGSTGRQSLSAMRDYGGDAANYANTAKDLGLGAGRPLAEVHAASRSISCTADTSHPAAPAVASMRLLDVRSATTASYAVA